MSIRKAQPTPNDVYIDELLTNISLAYIQSETDFIAREFAPYIPVDLQSSQYHIYDQDAFMNDDAVTVRTDGQESTGIGFTLSTDSYNATVWATHTPVGPQAMANQSGTLDLNRDATLAVTRRMLIRQEKIFVERFLSEGVWATELESGGSGDFIAWSDYANSTPRLDISRARIQQKARTGFTPNTLVFNEETLEVLLHHPEFESLFEGSDSKIVNRQRLAAALNVDRILVSGAVSRTTPDSPDKDSAEFGFVTPNHALLAYVSPTPGPRIPSAAYTFGWRGLLGVNADSGRIVNIPTPLLGVGSYRIEGEFAKDMKVTGPSLGTLFKNVIA